MKVPGIEAMTDLRELEKRLEEATGCNQELDAALWSLWDKRPLEGPADGLRIYKRDPEDRGAFDLPPNYTASLDAAVALVERCLPDAFPTIDRYSISDEPTTAQYNWRVWIKWVDGDDIIREAFSGTKATPALALCLALIRALIAKGDRHD